MRGERVAKNEALFRDVNERIREISPADDEIEFVCECGLEGCVEPIAVPASDYERVRSHPTWFLVARGHETPSVERVTEEGSTYAVVEKLPDEASVALDTDPR